MTHLSFNYFQERVRVWTEKCFGKEIASNKQERNFRFFEESTELVQALGMTKEEAYKLIDYVYGRPVGEPKQETGGVLVTLAALGNANGINLSCAGFDELNIVWDKIDAIREKQAKKQIKGGPLP